jgi:hypothetical protein
MSAGTSSQSKCQSANAGKKVFEPAGAAPVAHRGLGRVDLGDPVHELVAFGIDVVADRVDHHLSDREPARAHHARARKKRLPSRGAAPHVHARIARCAFVGVELLAQGRVDAVATDGHGAAHGGRIGEVDGDAARVLRHAGAAVVADDAVRAQALERLFEQHRLQVAAVDRELRPVVARMFARCFLEDQLAVLGEEDRLLRAHAHRVELRQQAELGQLAHRMRQQVHAHAHGLEFGHGLVHAAGNAGLVQAQREGQAADARAQDDHLLVVHGSRKDCVCLASYWERKFAICEI